MPLPLIPEEKRISIEDEDNCNGKCLRRRKQDNNFIIWHCCGQKEKEQKKKMIEKDKKEKDGKKKNRKEEDQTRKGLKRIGKKRII